MQKTKVAILGAGFIAEIHAESYRRFVPEAELVANYARAIPAKARAFCACPRHPPFLQRFVTRSLRTRGVRHRGHLPP